MIRTQIQIFRYDDTVKLLDQVNDFLDDLHDNDEVVNIKYYPETADSYQCVFIEYRTTI